MSEVIKRYTFFAYLDDDVAELDCHEEEDGNYVLASDYDKLAKANADLVEALEDLSRFTGTLRQLWDLQAKGLRVLEKHRKEQGE